MSVTYPKVLVLIRGVLRLRNPLNLLMVFSPLGLNILVHIINVCHLPQSLGADERSLQAEEAVELAHGLPTTRVKTFSFTSSISATYPKVLVLMRGVFRLRKPFSLLMVFPPLSVDDCSTLRTKKTL
ncbi:hypothetical protein O0L34_g12178 [Tuta absoluta]|nr:hypothetical protein O0L34_g12178 [Tuta absoluta]